MRNGRSGAGHGPSAPNKRAVVGAPVANVVIGFPESLFVRINAVAPSLVDRALRANDRKAAAIFNQSEQHA